RVRCRSALAQAISNVWQALTVLVEIVVIRSIRTPRNLVLEWSGDLRAPPSFPTRRSSDLRGRSSTPTWRPPGSASVPGTCGRQVDRKSTRLNSSHVESSYAVFGLKKKNGDHHRRRARRGGPS